MKYLCAAIGLAAVLVPATRVARSAQAAEASSRVEISFAASAHGAPVTGMVYLALSADNKTPPIQQTDTEGVPLFSKAVEELRPGAIVSFDAGYRGHPLASLREIPPGEYWMQPFVNVYTRFPRADGHTVWLHMDQWEGQHWQRSPGNLYGDPVHIRWDPHGASPIRLTADKVVPAISVPNDDQYVRRLKMQSAILTKWWGRPIYLGATVLLPRDYDRHPDVRYPIVYD